MSLADRIDAHLPQTQCGQCGYAGCRPYAEAIASDDADINQCPPGGASGIHALADLLGRAYKPLNPANGIEESGFSVAYIRESECIGCTKCIQACPVDAIIGANKWMHTVISAECTGCKLCIPPCPVDCIDLIALPLQKDAPQTQHEMRQQRAPKLRQRHQNRTQRLARETQARLDRLAAYTDAVTR